ncbi:non-specific serine/threonine protein kinase [Ranunculus cassubicifolius]
MDFLPCLLRLCLLVLVHIAYISCSGNDTDRHALLAFKDGISQDPHHVMSYWNDSAHFCKWVGVTCSLRHHQRVVALNLRSHELVGVISPSVGNLSFLTSIDLSSNNFNGKIPQEFGRLSRLQNLNLSYNSLGGEIPFNLSTCTELSVLSISYNAFIGIIPPQLSSLKKLTHLNLDVNNLTGTIPPWIGNCSSLIHLSLARNTLHGSIPNELGQLSQLQYFRVMLSGVIPPSLYNISSIQFFLVALNQLNGSIPPNVGRTLPNLVAFALDMNSFHGPIPNSLSNASNLQALDFEDNDFTGSVPTNFGSLQNLISLGFANNSLGYRRADDLNFITSLSNCTNMMYLSLASNHFGGVLPDSVGNLSTSLQTLAIRRNLIHGPLPTSIENLVNLTSLTVDGNLFSGSIPFGIGKLQRLHRLNLQENMLSGKIPSSLGNLTLLVYLYMGHNMLEGVIPPSLGNLKGLLEFNVSSNKLSGTVPKQVLTLSSLIFFDVANNSLSGSLPLEVGTLVNLEVLQVSENNFSGKIPNTIPSCLKLEKLFMGGNLFHGPIPPSFKDLREIQIIDFSHNSLSGKIPDFFTDVPFLVSLDLSYNDFEGGVPKEGIFKNASAITVRGNKKLCGGIKELHLPFCNEEEVERSRQFLSQRTVIIIAFGILSFIMVAISCFICWLRAFRKTDVGDATPRSSLEKWQREPSYLEIFNSTNGFSSECLIGTGSFGSVYKGVLSNQDIVVAIKVLNLLQKGASKSFRAECDALKNIRHRNLIKIVAVCSSIDFEGNEIKALIFEFMPNGSLEQWLHSNTNGHQQSRVLSFAQRVNIAIDVAFGLEYLHHGYGETIVHCDIKPSNILLDTDMTAHVGDFGLARFLFTTADDQSETQTLSSSLKGSIGYIPPEYGMGGHVSTHGDMYSYGILLLEMFTGKRPTDEMFKENQSLYNFVSMAMPHDVLDIVDASLISETQEDYENKETISLNEKDETLALSRKSMEWRREECLVAVLTIALSCCAPLPKDRSPLSKVINELIKVRELFCRGTDRKGCL